MTMNDRGRQAKIAEDASDPEADFFLTPDFMLEVARTQTPQHDLEIYLALYASISGSSNTPSESTYSTASSLVTPPHFEDFSHTPSTEALSPMAYDELSTELFSGMEITPTLPPSPPASDPRFFSSSAVAESPLKRSFDAMLDALQQTPQRRRVTTDTDRILDAKFQKIMKGKRVDKDINEDLCFTRHDQYVKNSRSVITKNGVQFHYQLVTRSENTSSLNSRIRSIYDRLEQQARVRDKSGLLLTAQSYHHWITILLQENNLVTEHKQLKDADHYRLAKEAFMPVSPDAYSTTLTATALLTKIRMAIFQLGEDLIKRDIPLTEMSIAESSEAVLGTNYKSFTVSITLSKLAYEALYQNTPPPPHPSR